MRSSEIKKKIKRSIDDGDLGAYLRLVRENAGLSQGDVAHALGLGQFQSISQWERNSSGSVPIPALLKLVDLYDIPSDELYEVLLKFQQQRLESKLEKKFYGKGRR